MSKQSDGNDPRKHECPHSGDLTEAQERYDEEQANRQEQPELTDAGDQGVALPLSLDETE